MELALLTFAWVLGITLRLSGLCGKHFSLINHLAGPVVPTLRQIDKNALNTRVRERLTEGN